MAAVAVEGMAMGAQTGRMVSMVYTAAAAVGAGTPVVMRMVEVFPPSCPPKTKPGLAELGCSGVR